MSLMTLMPLNDLGERTFNVGAIDYASVKVLDSTHFVIAYRDGEDVGGEWFTLHHYRVDRDGKGTIFCGRDDGHCPVCEAEEKNKAIALEHISMSAQVGKPGKIRKIRV